LRLSRYLAALALPRCAGTLVLVAVIYASVDLVEVGSLTGVSAVRLLLAYPFKLPSVAAQVLPLALIIGVLLTLSSLRRGGEWEALRSAGLSPRRLAVGLLVVPIIGAVLLVPVVEWLGPAASLAFERRITSGGEPAAETAVWSADDRGSLSRADPSSGCPDLLIERDADGRATAFESRERGRGNGQDPETIVWRLGLGWTRRASTAAGQRCQPSAVSAWSGSAIGLGGASLSRGRLSETIDRLEGRGRDATELRAQGALRVALIEACLIVPLLGLLLALGWDEARATRLTALGLAVGAAYWLALATAWNGAVLGVWSPLWLSVGVPILFGMFAVVAAVRIGRAATR
jgi:lipopolysaccharide export LptBFGC system permease protein LptF